MVAAMDPNKGHQCVIPNSIESKSIMQVRQLEHKPNCWTHCGRQRGWAGKCGYCGPKGYCCHSDGRGECPPIFSESVKGRSQHCMVPSSSRNEHGGTEDDSDCYDRRETICKSIDEVADFEECKKYFTKD